MSSYRTSAGTQKKGAGAPINYGADGGNNVGALSSLDFALPQQSSATSQHRVQDHLRHFELQRPPLVGAPHGRESGGRDS